MSWNSYIDSIVGKSNGSCDKVAIIGLEGGGCWTTSAHAQHWELTGVEGAAIAKALKSDDVTTFQVSGILVGGDKYQFIKHDKEEGFVLGKKKEKGAVTIHKSIQAVIIAHMAEGKQQGDVNNAVASIVEFLKSQGM